MDSWFAGTPLKWGPTLLSIFLARASVFLGRQRWKGEPQMRLLVALELQVQSCPIPGLVPMTTMLWCFEPRITYWSVWGGQGGSWCGPSWEQKKWKLKFCVSMITSNKSMFCKSPSIVQHCMSHGHYAPPSPLLMCWYVCHCLSHVCIFWVSMSKPNRTLTYPAGGILKVSGSLIWKMAAVT